MEIRRVCVLGAGALGRYFEQQFRSISEVSLLGRESTAQELLALKPDLVFVSVKAHQLEALSAKFDAALSSDAVLVLCCNGLGMYFQFATALTGKPHILRLLPNVGVQRDAANTITVSGALQGYLASTAQDNKLRDELRSFLEKAGWKVQVEKDIATAEWKKLLTNIVVNSIATICNAPNGIILERPGLKALASELLGEVREVAKADGFELASFSDESVFEGISNHRDNICSTLADIRAGRPTEIDYILGRFLSLAENYEIPVPISKTLYALLRGLAL